MSRTFLGGLAASLAAALFVLLSACQPVEIRQDLKGGITESELNISAVPQIRDGKNSNYIDLNSDGIFDLRDTYTGPGNDYGPLYVQLPDAIFVPVMTGLNAAGEEQIDSQPVGMGAVDVLDNDQDLMVNGFRAYAYVGPVKAGYHNINIDRVLEFGRDSIRDRCFFINQVGNRVNLAPAAVKDIVDNLRIDMLQAPKHV